ncbi:MAG TPA: hypothetical protein DCM54_05820 [Gammaproteobacteria bacterium]|nr:hypothetical protein [Gammaproteobacteria bacterium]
MQRIPLTILCITLAACGEGGGGNSETTITPPEPDPPSPLVFLDSMPRNTTSNVAGYQARFDLVYHGEANANYDLRSTCEATTFTVLRNVVDLANQSGDQLVNHKFTCPEASTAAGQEISVNTTIANESFEGSITFDTVSDLPSLNVLQTREINTDDVDTMFSNYIAGALLDELDLPPLVEFVILTFIVDLVSSAWQNLASPNASSDVVAQQVEYSSVDPDGSATHNLSGLIAFPNTDDFISREQIILLTHATGSTPSLLEDSDAWYILANLFAAHGYLVIAPDNLGRGSTDDAPETYLLANRTGTNAIDFVLRVLQDDTYTPFYNDETITLNIIGYSQGGHSAVASWLELLRHHPNLQASAVYLGGAPFDLYRTFRGVLQAVNEECNGDGYCSLVDPATHVPFATDRILPGMIEFTDVGVFLDDIVDDEELDAGFVSGFLDASPDYDNLRSLLQLNSFTNIANAESVFNDPGTTLHLYHSEYDRLVPATNTDAFLEVLNGNVAIIHHSDECNSTSFRLIFEAIDKVGVVHTLCGLNMLDEVFAELR